MLPYAPQYPHQAYGYELALTRLQHNTPARDWLAAADSALLHPQTIELPYAKADERIADSAAIGYAFTVPVGRRVAITVGDDSVSRVISLRLDEAQALADRASSDDGALAGVS